MCFSVWQLQFQLQAACLTEIKHTQIQLMIVNQPTTNCCFLFSCRKSETKFNIYQDFNFLQTCFFSDCILLLQYLEYLLKELFDKNEHLFIFFSFCFWMFYEFLDKNVDH